ncbi:MAG: hypothetical protein ACTSO7_18975 [Candidatus Heimdallarchaeota archaeon]
MTSKNEELLKKLDAVIDDFFCGGFPDIDILEYDEIFHKKIKIIDKLLKRKEEKVMPIIFELLPLLNPNEWEEMICRWYKLFVPLKDYFKKKRKLLTNLYTIGNNEHFNNYSIKMTYLEFIDEIDEFTNIYDTTGSLKWINKNYYTGNLWDGRKFGEDDSEPAKVAVKIIELIVKYKIMDAIPILEETISGSYSIIENKAIWALSELGGERSLITLMKIKLGLIIQQK